MIRHFATKNDNINYIADLTFDFSKTAKSRNYTKFLENMSYFIIQSKKDLLIMIKIIGLEINLYVSFVHSLNHQSIFKLSIHSNHLITQPFIFSSIHPFTYLLKLTCSTEFVPQKYKGVG